MLGRSLTLVGNSTRQLITRSLLSSSTLCNNSRWMSTAAPQTNNLGASYTAAPPARPSPQRGRRPNKQKSPSFPQYAHIPRLATEGMQRVTEMGFNYYLIDVRPAEQFQQEAVMGSVNFPSAQGFSAETLKALDKSSMVLLMGPKEKGYPAACEAALEFTKQGFKSVIVVESSVKELVDNGFFYSSEKDTL
ncbi:hypothetical protein SAMD00019534_076840, partial [Acytostelium subglobosum LB1]|uniref:hypothetical protein n=1 Tax=Acytostelium subglobosum LB1 TaxID=1410327 RepID=UPI0006448D2B